MTLQQLLDYIDARIKQNGNREITAPIDNDVRKAIVNYFNDVIGNLEDLDTSTKTSVVNAINAIFDDIDLSGYIEKDKGIELETGKGLPQYTGDLNDLKTTSFVRGKDLSNEPVASGSSGPSGNSWKIYRVFDFGNDIILQLANNIGGDIFAYRMKYSGLGGWGAWHYLMDDRDLATINSALAGKEPKIAPKSDSFNKPFGFSAGTIMEGNRMFSWSEILDRPFDLWKMRVYDASATAAANFDNWYQGIFQASNDFQNYLWEYYFTTPEGQMNLENWGNANMPGQEPEWEFYYRQDPQGIMEFQMWQDTIGRDQYILSPQYANDFNNWKSLNVRTYEDYKASGQWTIDYAAWESTANLGREEYLDAILNSSLQQTIDDIISRLEALEP